MQYLKETDGTSARKQEVKPPSDMERLKFALIKDVPRLPNARFVGMHTAPVSPWPHQRNSELCEKQNG
jgi:hypothetical protein